MRAVDPKDRPTGVTRITLLEEDGSEKVLDITEDRHFIFAFVKVSLKRGVEIPAETLIKGNENVCGELFYQIGLAHPEIIQHCRKRAIEKGLKKLRAAGIDLGAETFENTPAVGGTQ
ncbi:MAG: hypothetical protein WBM29_13270 [Candidatus Deferrimicrobium sp.]